MTNQSIAYANFVEAQRHNLAMERQEAANLRWRKIIEQHQLEELARSNLAKEQENVRHNQSSEYNERQSNKIQDNRNVATIMYNYSNLEESKRHNLASEKLSTRQQDWTEYAGGRNIYLDAQRTDAQKELWRSQAQANQVQASLAPYEAQTRRIGANASQTQAAASQTQAAASMRNAETQYQGMLNQQWYNEESINSLNWKQWKEYLLQRDKIGLQQEELDRKYPFAGSGWVSDMLRGVSGFIPLLK